MSLSLSVFILGAVLAFSPQRVSSQPAVPPPAGAQPAVTQPAVPPPAGAQPAVTPPAGTRVQAGVTSETSAEAELPLFGRDFFKLPTNTAIISAGQPPHPFTAVPPTYSLGPGDVLKISFWSKTIEATTYTIPIAPDGTIFISPVGIEAPAAPPTVGTVTAQAPTVGPVTAQGLTLAQLRGLLLREFSRYYKDVNLEVTLATIRTVQVFITGEATTPGGYILTAVSTAFNAIYNAGGPTETGSMRGIRLIRNNKTVGTIDMYHYLLSGEKAEDYPLESGDTIFMPVIGPVASINGEILRPYRYELKGTEHLSDLVALAGGITSKAYLQQARIARIKENKERILVNVDLSAVLAGKAPDQDIPLQDGDKVYIYEVLPDKMNTVSIGTWHDDLKEWWGHVQRPGKYELKPEMRVSDLIETAEGLTHEEIYLERANLYRTLPDTTIQVIPFNLGKALQKDPAEDLKLQKQDNVVVYSRKEAEFLDRTVSIDGSVQHPTRSGTPGTPPIVYERKEGMRVKDLILAAGGLLPEASPMAEIARARGENEVEIITVDLNKLLSGDQEQNVLLQDRDRVSIKAISTYMSTAEAATISGEVKLPGPYALRTAGMKLSTLVEEAGGLTEDAYPEGAVFVRRLDRLMSDENLSAAKRVQKTFTDMATSLYNLELAKLSTGATPLPTAPPAGVGTLPGALSSAAGAPAKQTVPLVPQELPVIASGRVAIDLKRILETKGAEGDIVLEDGDQITIPKTPLTVEVTGDVANPMAIIYQPKEGLDYYVERAGGYTWGADVGSTVVIRANGEVVPRQRVRTIERGDIIHIPAQVVVEVPKTKSERFRDQIGLVANITGIIYVIHLLTK